MRNLLRSTAKSFIQKVRNVRGEYTHSLVKVKTKLIDMAFNRYEIKSFVDAGGCWGVNGGYTFHALSNFQIDRAVIVDHVITQTTQDRATKHDNLRLVIGNFGNSKVIDSLGRVDAVIFYDVLLHQVRPSWDEIIERYSKITDHFIIYNQMFIGSYKTIRLIDLGLDEYLKNTPYKGREDEIRHLFQNLDKDHPTLGTKYRDVYQYWQWGITPSDLLSVMSKNQFRVDYVCNYGRFLKLPYFENHGMLFSRTERHPNFAE